MRDPDKNKPTHIKRHGKEQSQHTLRNLNRKDVKLAILGMIVMIGLVFGVVVIGKAVDRHAVNDPYCESIDPTECEAAVTIHNDTTTTYTVKQCMDDEVPCNQFWDTKVLGQGMDEKANGSTDDTPEVWIVDDNKGKIAGCLNLEFTKQYTNLPVTVLLSNMQSCSSVKSEVAANK